MTSVMQFGVTAAALMIAASVAYYTVSAATSERNASLVSIGIAVLRADPEKEKDLSIAAREWALDLIDANAGGVKFSPEARSELLKNALRYSDYPTGTYFDYAPYSEPLAGPPVTPSPSRRPKVPILPPAPLPGSHPNSN
jgi:hypothetical protein